MAKKKFLMDHGGVWVWRGGRRAERCSQGLCSSSEQHPRAQLQASGPKGGQTGSPPSSPATEGTDRASLGSRDTKSFSRRLCAPSKLPHLVPQPQGTWQDKRVTSDPKAHLLNLLFTHGWSPEGKNRNHSLGGIQSPAGGGCRRSGKGQHQTMPKHQVWGDGGEMGREVLGRGFWGRGILGKPKVG